MDSSRGHCLQEVHHSQRRVELWYRHVGGSFVWGETLLGHEQPGCESVENLVVKTREQPDKPSLSSLLPFVPGDQSHRRGLPPACSHGLSTGAAPVDAGLLGEGASRAAHLQPDT